jgi:hypothetical protein
MANLIERVDDSSVTERSVMEKSKKEDKEKVVYTIFPMIDVLFFSNFSGGKNESARWSEA